MSRVYEALKRAERQQIVDESSTDSSLQLNGIVKPSTVGSANGYTEQQIPERSRGRLELLPVEKIVREEDGDFIRTHSDAPAKNRGPLLVVGRSDYAADAEPFHLLALSVESWANENGKRCFTITSALSGEGKSFVALNLAASLAMAGNRVLLVDADLRRPVLHYPFNIAPMHGLIDYLNGKCDLEDCLQPTSIPGLVLAPAGGTSHAPAELLARAQTRDFIKKARGLSAEQYIIVDSPAASMVPEPQILNRLSDALLIVVAANRTPREVVRQTIEGANNSLIFGLVLNRFEAAHSTLRNYPEAYARRRNGTANRA